MDGLVFVIDQLGRNILTLQTENEQLKEQVRVLGELLAAGGGPADDEEPIS